MTFLDTSVIIDYLEGIDSVVSFVDDQDTLFTASICVYEVLEGEVFGPGKTDVFQTRQAFGRVQALDFTEAIAIEAANLQADLLQEGTPVSPRDTMIAATAQSTGDILVTADADFKAFSETMDVVTLS